MITQTKLSKKYLNKLESLMNSGIFINKKMFYSSNETASKLDFYNRDYLEIDNINKNNYYIQDNYAYLIKDNKLKKYLLNKKIFIDLCYRKNLKNLIILLFFFNYYVIIIL